MISSGGVVAFYMLVLKNSFLLLLTIVVCVLNNWVRLRYRSPVRHLQECLMTWMTASVICRWEMTSSDSATSTASLCSSGVLLFGFYGEFF